MIELAIFIVGFIFASGFFAMIDAAILSVGPAEVEVLIAKKRWGATALKSLLKHITRAIIVIVILTNVTNILGPILAGRKAEAIFGSSAIGVITAVLTFMTIIFSEIIPKAIGAHHAPRISRMAAPFLRALVVILFPVVYLLEKLVHLFKSGKRKVGTEEQIRALANLGGGTGHIDADERELIHKAFVLNDRTTAEVMTPAAKIIYCQTDTTIQRAAKIVFKHSYSRYPVIGSSPDDMRGYIRSRDVLEALAYGEGEASVLSIVRPISQVKGEMRCDDLLHFLRKNMAQLAIVVDGNKTIGLVTLEDALEELVGSIADENDKMEQSS
ncbi:hypothetical protein AUJ46_06250 [Candidatus Peregrinibacteria bacterium CG1_02_54_53]|nr:MAG: hypothetical protein AUJ46_06250 [Candidatus Peregrinibacteria bacterium CG1_02_54_53]